MKRRSSSRAPSIRRRWATRRETAGRRTADETGGHARSSSSKGSEGEERAARYLEGQGFRILERNFRIRRGEVDIIAVRGNILVFCEVKAWRSLPMESLEHALSRGKRRRIITTASFFLLERPELRECQVRFDVLYIPEPTGNVCHIEGAFDGDY